MHPLLITLAIFAFTIPLPLIIQALIATVLPLLVALVTRYVTSSTTKGLILLGLSILSAGLTELLASINAGNPFDIGLWILAAIGTFITGAGVYFGLWKGTALQQTLQAVGSDRDARGRFIAKD